MHLINYAKSGIHKIYIIIVGHFNIFHLKLGSSSRQKLKYNRNTGIALLTSSVLYRYTYYT